MNRIDSEPAANRPSVNPASKPHTVWGVLAICAGAAAALVVNEFAMGVVAPSFNPRAQVKFVDIDDAGPLPTTGEPNTVTRQVKNTGDYDVSVAINRFGFRDSKDISTALPRDYVMVGDSFIFGWGVEEKDRVSNVLERSLNTRVFNIGVTGSIDDYEVLLDYAAQLGAQIGHVIVCVTMENDLRRYATEKLPAKPAESGPPPAGNLLQTTKVWLMTHSALYFATTTAIHQISWLEDAMIRAGFITANLDGIHRQTFDGEAIDLSAGRLADIAKRYQATFLLIPSRALWHGDTREEARATHDAFVLKLQTLGLDFVDLAPLFERGGNPLSYHFKKDGHWNPTGHKRAADALAAYLAKRH